MRDGEEFRGRGGEGRQGGKRSTKYVHEAVVGLGRGLGLEIRW